MEELFRRSVEGSLFLPEPDGSMDGWLNSDPSVGEEFGEFVEELANSGGYVTDTKEASSTESIGVGSAQSVEVNLVNEVTSVPETSAGKVIDMGVVKFADITFTNVSLYTEDSVDGGNSGMALEFPTEGIVIQENHKVTRNPDGLASSSVGNGKSGGTGVSETGDHGRDQMANVCSRNGSLIKASDTGNSSTTKTPNEIWQQHENRPDNKLPDKSAMEDESNILTKLGFLPMNLTIFENIRNTFGSEECEFCGRLFVSKSESRLHQRIHTGSQTKVLIVLSSAIV